MIQACQLMTGLKQRIRLRRPKKAKAPVQVSLYPHYQRWSPFGPHTPNAVRTTISRPASRAVQAPRGSGIEQEVDDCLDG